MYILEQKVSHILDQWDIAPKEIIQKNSLSSFKEAIKMCVLLNYPCRLCKVYLDGVCFINTIWNNFPLKICFMLEAAIRECNYFKIGVLKN